MDAIIKPGPEAGGASVPLSQSWSDSLEPHIGRRAPGTVWESQVTRYICTNTQNTNTNMNGLTHLRLTLVVHLVQPGNPRSQGTTADWAGRVHQILNDYLSKHLLMKWLLSKRGDWMVGWGYSGNSQINTNGSWKNESKVGVATFPIFLIIHHIYSVRNHQPTAFTLNRWV